MAVGTRRGDQGSIYNDSCGVFKDAVISIMATLAKQEAVKRSERTKAGCGARVRAAGRVLGRPKAIASHSAVAQLKSAGLSNRAIGRDLGISEATVRKLLKLAA
jgi:DNA invertase Pin-like site-specific DNA recombinase